MTDGIHMTITIHKLTIIILLIAATGCAPTPTQMPTPTEPVLADSFFSGRALLDANGNGQIDSEDTPIANATFHVEINGVKVFGDATDETGNAFILVPGGVKYPVDVSMEAPKDSALKLITPSSVTVSAPAGTVQFLFSK